MAVRQFAKDHAGAPLLEAATEGARQPLFPASVMMTSLALHPRLLPLVIATGASQFARRNVGTPVFRGMILASLIGIFAIPPLYVSFQWLREKIRPGARPQIERTQPGSEAATRAGTRLVSQRPPSSEGLLARPRGSALVAGRAPSASGWLIHVSGLNRHRLRPGYDALPRDPSVH